MSPQPLADVEVIACGAAILRELGVLDRAVLEINTLGDSESRRAYRDVLVTYLRQFWDKLSEDSRLRLERNPLRVARFEGRGRPVHYRRGTPLSRPPDQSGTRVLR